MVSDDRPVTQKEGSPLAAADNNGLPVITGDTITVCVRNSISDFTFYDSTNVITRIDLNSSGRFPFSFIEKNSETEARSRELLIKELRQGDDLPAEKLHSDWLFGVLFISMLLFTVVTLTSRNIFQGAARFFLFRGIKDSATQESRVLIRWQSVMLNIAAFFTISLFCYSAAAIYDLIPAGVNGLLFWLFSLAFVTAAVSLRHLSCIVTGNMSGERETFSEYLSVVYSSYRYSALALFILLALMNYTLMLPESAYIIPGAVIVALMYLVRVFRLMLIFLKRGISIFYLILYLCALEILPVVVAIKYFTGLV